MSGSPDFTLPSNNEITKTQPCGANRFIVHVFFCLFLCFCFVLFFLYVDVFNSALHPSNRWTWNPWSIEGCYGCLGWKCLHDRVWSLFARIKDLWRTSRQSLCGMSLSYCGCQRGTIVNPVWNVFKRWSSYLIGKSDLFWIIYLLKVY